MNIPEETQWNDYHLFNLKDNECVIYFLYDENNEIIYIGKTISFSNRMATHKVGKKEVRKVRYFIAKESEGEEIETYLIKLHKPKLNVKDVPKKEYVYTTWQEATLEEIQKFFIDNNIDITYFSEKSGCSTKLINGLLKGTHPLKKITAQKMKILMRVYERYWKNQAIGIQVKEEDLIKGKEGE